MNIKQHHHVTQRDISKAGSVVTSTGLNDTYREVLDFALRYKLRCARRDGRNPQLPATMTDALLRLVIAGQAGRMAPEKLKRMIVSASSRSMSHRSWQIEPGAEQRAGLLAGSSRLVRTG